MYNFAQYRILMSLGNFYPPITHHLNGKPFTISFIHIVRVFFVSHSIFVHFVTLNVVWCNDSVQFDWIRFNFIRQNSDSLFSRFLLLNDLISSVTTNFSIISRRIKSIPFETVSHIPHTMRCLACGFQLNRE